VGALLDHRLSPPIGRSDRAALHWACKECQVACIELLLAAVPPADPSIQSARGQTAADVMVIDHPKAAEARSLLLGNNP